MTAPPVAYELHRRQYEAMEMLLGDHVNQLLYGGAAGGGKALGLSTQLGTPTGWVAMGDIQVGDELFDESGAVTTVTRLFDVFIPERSYKLIFDDGSSVDACGEHQWLTFDAKELAALTRRSDEWRAKRRLARSSRATGLRSAAFTAAITERNKLRQPPTLPVPKGTVRTTDEIVATLRTPSGRTNHAVPVAHALELPEADLPLDPYILGLWLGDGSKNSGYMVTMDAEIEAACEAAGFPWSSKRRAHGRAWSATALGLRPPLRAAGVLGNKHIPPQYLRASRAQRLALLQGLMDTDGTVSDTGRPEFTNTNRAVIDGAYELIVSLGWKATIREGRAKFDGRDYGPKWDIKWTPDEYVFRLTRKRDLQQLAQRRTTKFRYIVDAEPIEPIPMRCISVDSPSHLYLAGPSMVPTHNSHLLRALAYTLAQVWPRSRIPIFRLTLPELEETHIDPWLTEMANLGYAIEDCWRDRPKNFTFPNGSIVSFRHIDPKLGAKKWLSAQWAALLIDEGGTFNPKDIPLLYSRVRRPQEGDAAHWRDWHPMMVIATNPGGPAHSWLRQSFVEPAVQHGGTKAMWEDEISLPDGSVEPIKRGFLQSKLEDNASITYREYVASLADLPEEDRARMLDGDWDYFEGRVFTMLPEVHLVDREWVFGSQTPPPDWPRMVGYDHGNQNPAAAEWITRDEDGNYIVYQEYYSPGSNTKHIDAIWELMQYDGVMQPQLMIIADPQMGRKSSSRGQLVYSVAEEFFWGGMDDTGNFRRHRGLQLRFPHLERRTGREVLRRLTERNPERVFPHWHPRAGEFGAPQLYIARQCPQLWREMQGIQYKANDPDEDTVKSDDHAFDALWRVAPMMERFTSGRLTNRLRPLATLEAR